MRAVLVRWGPGRAAAATGVSAVLGLRILRLAPPGESKDEDTNGDGMPDACEAFDFFSDEQSFEIYPGGSDEVQADPIRITVDEEEVELDDGEADVSTATDEPGDATGVAEQEAVALVARSRCSTACSPSGRLRTT